jgi:hypothetical protein
VHIHIALTSYKLVQFLGDYVQKNRPDIKNTYNLTDIQTLLSSSDNVPRGKRAIIRTRTARRWLNRLGFSWKDIRKGVFFDGHEREDVVEYRKVFLDTIHSMLPYMVEFDKDGTIQPKEYPSDCCVGGSSRRPIIFITHDESVFSANDGRHQAWIAENGVFLRPKGKGRGIMVSDFLLPWSRLNLLSLPKEQQEELNASGVPLEAVELFEYGKDKGYWDGENLLKQIESKALPIAEALYPGYEFLFAFDNATSHAVYANDALRTPKMNKGEGGQQPLLRDGWYLNDQGLVVPQRMIYIKEDPATGLVYKVPKGIQRVLEERKLWPSAGLLLECPKPRCDDCASALANCKDCIKCTRCESCKQEKVHSSQNCNKKEPCDNCRQRKERCQCVRKQTCISCKKIQKGECDDCKNIPPKCSTESKLLLFLLIFIFLTRTDCCARRLLSLQPDFIAQKCEIEEKLDKHHVLFYPKFHCELNHIEYFWCQSKRYARENCDYTIEGLRDNVPAALTHVNNSTILGCYRSCLKKMDLYRQGIVYGSGQWKKLTSHQKPYLPGDDR